ncbi:hypothetical protein QR98_0073800 [Sarcoptes scabiei]|uniref:Uncharacterized protein n=1 Tax=Sarcoptes scabiei TaxID=52283 RepID=A0A132AE81_SARSC|nr:hypothetical protein QR98_0073800 [Sarcoptes scabiei]
MGKLLSCLKRKSSNEDSSNDEPIIVESKKISTKTTKKDRSIKFKRSKKCKENRNGSTVENNRPKPVAFEITVDEKTKELTNTVIDTTSLKKNVDQINSNTTETNGDTDESRSKFHGKFPRRLPKLSSLGKNWSTTSEKKSTTTTENIMEKQKKAEEKRNEILEEKKQKARKFLEKMSNSNKSQDDSRSVHTNNDENEIEEDNNDDEGGGGGGVAEDGGKNDPNRIEENDENPIENKVIVMDLRTGNTGSTIEQEVTPSAPNLNR